MSDMRRTMLDLVQQILSELDSDPVNSIGETIESAQVAGILENTYYDLIAYRDIPENKELIRLTALSDNTKPNYLKLPSNAARVPAFFEYNKAKADDTNTIQYRKVLWEDQFKFIDRLSSRNSSSANIQIVNDVSAGTELLIKTDKMPDFFTSFDDRHIVCDSFDASVDNTLQAGKTRAWAKVVPSVTMTDSGIFDIDAEYFPYIFNEALSRASVVLKGVGNEKAEQWARRHKSFIQSRKNKFALPNERPKYGR